MAFVYKSDNERSIIINNQSDLGPGEYLDKNIIIEYKQHQEPFLSSINGTLGLKNENPGPGAYYKDVQQIKNRKNLMKSEYSKNIDSIRAQVTKNSINLKKVEIFGFDSKVKRFTNDNNRDNNTPGPGYYFPSILNNTIKNKNMKNNKGYNYIKIKPKISAEKIGLPSTFAIQTNNQVLRKTFQYDNFGCRPKIFNMRKYKEFIELNNSSFASTNYSDNKKLMKSLYHNSSIKKSNSMDYNKELKNDIKKIYKNNSNSKNALNCRINFCKKMNNKKRKAKNGLERIIENISPGPGYYFDSINDIGIKVAKPKSDSYQFFGTKSNRFYNLNKSWTKLGPGEYFISKQNEDNNQDDDDIVHIPFGSKGKRDNSFLCLENTKMNPGPGEYEIESFTNNAEFDMISDRNNQFGISGERFNDKYIMKDKYSSPGPGYYNPKYDYIKPLFNDNIKLNKKNIFLKIHNKYNNSNYKKEKKKIKNLDNPFINGINTSLEEFKNKEKIPPVGYYYPEFFNTIDYKNKKKILDSNQDGVCFNRTISNKLKKSSSTNELLGPGYYNNVDNKKFIYFQIKPPFHNSSERGLTPKKKEKYNINLNDLRQHYMKEYFNWNKKSFNINFI